MGFLIEYLEEISSTQPYLLEKAGAQELPAGYTVFAGRQTAGRGRRGRSFWMSPEGGLPFSSWFPLDLSPRDLLWIPAVAGVALAEVLSEWAEVYLRWPNDLVSRTGGKVAGILCESVFSGSRLRGVVVGIGINLYFAPGEPPPELRGIALSLDQLPSPPGLPSEERRDRLRNLGTSGKRTLIEAWLARMMVAREEFCDPRRREGLLNRYNRFLCPELRAVRFRLGKEMRIGYIIKVNPQGSLEIRDLKGGAEYTVLPDALLDEDLPLAPPL